jgi:hypothetical protein
VQLGTMQGVGTLFDTGAAESVVYVTKGDGKCWLQAVLRALRGGLNGLRVKNPAEFARLDQFSAVARPNDSDLSSSREVLDLCLTFHYVKVQGADLGGG